MKLLLRLKCICEISINIANIYVNSFSNILKLGKYVIVFFILFSISGPCSGFLCQGSESCTSSGKADCDNIPQYCIDSSLRCNKIPNCAALDNSDEKNCKFIFVLLIYIINYFTLSKMLLSGKVGKIYII